MAIDCRGMEWASSHEVGSLLETNLLEKRRLVTTGVLPMCLIHAKFRDVVI